MLSHSIEIPCRNPHSLIKAQLDVDGQNALGMGQIRWPVLCHWTSPVQQLSNVGRLGWCVLVLWWGWEVGQSKVQTAVWICCRTGQTWWFLQKVTDSLQLGPVFKELMLWHGGTVSVRKMSILTNLKRFGKIWLFCKLNEGWQAWHMQSWHSM